MNPDGFAAKPTPTRNNAHDVDLNRDFPDQVCCPTLLLPE
jgi:murein tripeptide amidase MpaA